MAARKTRAMVTRDEFVALADKVESIETVQQAHQTLFAVREKTDELIDHKFEHLEKEVAKGFEAQKISMDEKIGTQNEQTKSIQSTLKGVMWLILTTLVAMVGFVMKGVVTVG